MAEERVTLNQVRPCGCHGGDRCPNTGKLSPGASEVAVLLPGGNVSRQSARRAMPKRAKRRCVNTGCGGTAEAGEARCARCAARHAHQRDQRRGTPISRGYGAEHRDRFRATVLARDPVCVLCGKLPAAVADHYPVPRARAGTPRPGRQRPATRTRTVPPLQPIARRLVPRRPADFLRSRPRRPFPRRVFSPPLRPSWVHATWLCEDQLALPPSF